MHTLRTVILTLVIALVLGIGGALVAIYTGAWDVSAQVEDGPILTWLAKTTREHSIEARAEKIQPPSNLGDREIVLEGFKHYREMCVECHRKPGTKETEISQGLNPKPPNISQWKHVPDAKEVFWVLKHGIRMTGMPAWGPTHSDDKLWALVAFVRDLPGMTVQQWETMDKTAGPPGGHEEDEDQGSGSAGHDSEHGQ